MDRKGEVTRRLACLRALMHQNNFAAVVITGNAEFQQKGYIRYYADWRLYGGAAHMVVFPAEDPILFLGLGAQAEWAKELSAIPDTRAVLDKTAAVIDAIEARTSPGDRIGVVGLNTILPHGEAVRLIDGLLPSVVKDATDMVEGVWGILSPTDLVDVEVAHNRVAKVFDAFRDAIRPQRSERAVVADAVQVAVRQGCLEGVIHLNNDLGSGTRPATDRVFGRDDIVKMFMEFLTPEGYLIELGGCFSFRPPEARWAKKFDLVGCAIENAMAATRPGRVADDVVQAIRRTYEAAGVDIVGRRLWDFHGQGMHSLLRPFGLPGATDPIHENTMINIHPGLLTADGLGISATSNYIVTPDGGVPLGRFRHRWHVVG
ncbi:Xaa-Pro aminopeptidase [Roseicitreum antarcticum]|uniref:Xaa-Pro aminopeptidase n=2 Tax=Roseicitreum antarcticum TaxID=564137 RepID=A0A1H3AUL5_9RHOB|nr:Xaa-Pro aminopeptidase [Roseicitreum antarcticum]